MKILSTIMGILLVIGGVYCMLTPGITFLTLGWVLGVLLLISGIELIVCYFGGRKVCIPSAWDLALGILTTVLAIVILTNNYAQFFTELILAYMLGVWIVVSGALRIFAAFGLKKLEVSIWWLSLVVGVLLILAGIYAFFHPIVAAITLGVMAGLYVTVQGVNLIVFGISMRKRT